MNLHQNVQFTKVPRDISLWNNIFFGNIFAFVSNFSISSWAFIVSFFFILFSVLSFFCLTLVINHILKDNQIVLLAQEFFLKLYMRWHCCGSLLQRMQCSKLADKTALYQFNLNESRELFWSWNVLSKAYHITIKTLENFYVRLRMAFAFAPEEPSISTDVKKIRREKNIFRICHTNRESVYV